MELLELRRKYCELPRLPRRPLSKSSCHHQWQSTGGRLGDEQRGSNERSGTGISEVEVVERAHRHGLMCGAGGRRWRRVSLRMGMAAVAEGE
jgi:hypothetical protein